MLNNELLNSLSNVQSKCENVSEKTEKIYSASSCVNTCWGRCSGAEFCFITTATCGSFGKADDCHELTVLRRFRDTYMEQNEKMRSEVAEYYLIAPKICKNIDKMENHSEIYESIWNNWLNDAVKAVDNGDNDKAYKIYKDMVLSLKDKYLKED